MKITANMVTIARIFLLPLPCMLLLYGGTLSLCVAFALFALLGMTDFVDGMMARREGPTKLGGLIDPVADKIFVAAVALPLAGMGLIPPWGPVAILSREFLLTILRTSVALRKESVKTSMLGKMKTIIQMGGFGTIFLTLFLPKAWALGAAFALFASLSLLWGFLKFKNPKEWPPFWILPVAGSFLYWLLLLLLFSQETAVLLQLIVIVAITWISALDYLVTTYRIFSRSGLHTHDAARIFWALAHSLCVVPIVSLYPNTVLPILVSVSLELALGGVDNVVAAERNYAGIRPFITTGILAVMFGVSAYGNVLGIWNLNLMMLATLVVLGSMASFVVTYRRWHFIFKRVFN